MIAFTFAARARKREARTAAVLDHLAEHPDSSGYGIHKGARVSMGWVYVALDEVERDGRITARWADGPMPRRGLYRLAEEANR